MPYDKETLIKYQILKAHEAMDDAKFNLENNKLSTAANRIYYAIFYIVSALALKNDYSTSKHGQLLGWFIKNYVKNGIITYNFSAIYNNVYKFRQKSDYDLMVYLTREDVEKHFNDMVYFVNEIEKLINS